MTGQPGNGPAAATAAGFRVVVMGVSGSGKTTVGALVAAELGGDYVDGDALHPPVNIDKMSRGVPLEDDDRRPWLAEVGARLEQARRDGETLVVGCSALKRSYRDVIRAGAPEVVFVHLHGSRDLLWDRMKVRPGHFMPVSLLDSQLATLELLGEQERGRVFDVSESPETLAAVATAWLRCSS